MKFAIVHPIIGHPYDPALVSGDGVADVAVAAERAGFDGFGFTDHPAPTQRWLDAGGHDAFDPFVAMAFAAARTTTLRMIPNIVVLPYRNPFIVAKAGATLDRLSNGRFILATGAGYLKGEYAALGVSHADRNEIFDEAIDAIKLIWTQDDITFNGKHFQARGITGRPRPVSDPHPPIWIGGNSVQARQRVAERGDGWCPFPAPAFLARTSRTVPMETPDDLAVALGDLRRRTERAGRDPSKIDVTFSNSAGGSPATDRFNADEHLEGVARLAALGVSWVYVSLPGDSIARALETLQKYGEQVISRL